MKTYSANIQAKLYNAGFVIEKSHINTNNRTKSLHKITCLDTRSVYMQGSYLGELLIKFEQEVGL